MALGVGQGFVAGQEQPDSVYQSRGGLLHPLPGNLGRGLAGMICVSALSCTCSRAGLGDALCDCPELYLEQGRAGGCSV